MLVSAPQNVGQPQQTFCENGDVMVKKSCSYKSSYPIEAMCPLKRLCVSIFIP